MSPNKTTSVYSRLFDPLHNKDQLYYRSIFINPIHEHALESILIANSESIDTSTQLEVKNVAVLQELFAHAVEMLVEATMYPLPVEQFTPVPATSPRKSIGKRHSITPLDDIGEDITSLNGSTKSNFGSIPASAASSLVDLDEEDDITMLHGSTPKSTRSRSGSILSLLTSGSKSKAAILNATQKLDSSKLKQKRTQLESIDDILRTELIINILKVLHIWFRNVNNTNTVIRKTKANLGVSGATDVLVSMFGDSNATTLSLDISTLETLLKVLKWYLSQNITNTLSIKEVISLLYQIVKTLYKSASNNNLGKESLIRSLFLTIYKVDFAPELSSILDVASSVTEDIPGSVKNEREISLSLSCELFMEIQCIIGILIKVPPSSISYKSSSLSADITTNEFTNSVEHLFNSKKYSKQDIYQQVFAKIIPILAVNFNYLYDSKQDLLLHDITNTSFISWIAGSLWTSGYPSYETTNNVTNLNNNKIQFKESDHFIRGVSYFFTTREKIWKQNENTNGPFESVETPDLLPISLFMYSQSKNEYFLEYLTEKYHPLVEYDQHIEVFDIWLASLSYVFTNQHRSPIMHSITRVALLLLLRLTSKNSIVRGVRLVEKLNKYQINEFKWKVCHQRNPILPTSSEKGYKSSLYYILDILQILIRFNLTKKLDVASYRLTFSIIRQIVDEFTIEDIKLDDSFSWNEFSKTIFGFLLFTWKQKLILVEKRGVEVKHLVEETLFIIDEILAERFLKQNVNISYDLVYSVLLHRDCLQGLIGDCHLDLSRFKNLQRCIEYLEEKLGSDRRTIDIEYGTSEFTQIVKGFQSMKVKTIEEPKNKPENEIIFKNIHKPLYVDVEGTLEMVRIVDATLLISW